MASNCWRVRETAVTALLVLAAAGCDLLEVTDPTAIEEERLNNAPGAALLRGDALARFYANVAGLAVGAGQASDEFTFFSSVAWLSESRYDRRDADSSVWGWENARLSATVAFSKLETFGPAAHAGEMLALRGQAALRLAANYCPGFAMTELDGYTVQAGSPVTTEQAYERALADFDAALTFAADSARVLNFARVGRAATLLGLGRFPEAASAAQGVPTSYTWNARYIAGTSFQKNPLVNTARPGYEGLPTVADREGGSGLDFISADDPRVQVSQYAVAAPPMGSGEPLYNAAKYANDGAPIVVASGIQARLIEAEAVLAGGDGAWLSILNDLRATQVTPALAPLADPGTPDARLDLLFRERAFWLFATGHRLADMLRLVRLYDRDPASVFPSGAYHQHGVMYGSATSLRFNPAETGTPASVTGCTGT